MNRLIGLITIAIIFVAVAGSLSGYAIGFGVSNVAAQDDHGGDDGGGDHGDDGGGGGGDDDADDHADSSSGVFIPDADDHTDSAGSGEFIPDADDHYDAGGYFDDTEVSDYTFEYFGDSGFALFNGVVFDPANDMDAMREAGLFYYATDPVETGVGAPSDGAIGFFSANSEAFYDTVYKDNTELQFFDVDTGEHIDPENRDFSLGGFTSELRSEDALSAYDQAAGITPGHFFEQGGDFSFDLAQDFRGFSDLGEQAVFDMYEAMGVQFHNLDASQMAGMFNSLNESQLHEIGGDQIFDAVGQWSGGDFQGIAGE